MNLILLHPGEASASANIVLTDGRAAHLQHVLKVSPGQPVRVGIVDGPLGVGIVAEVAEAHVTLRCHFDDDTPPRPRIDLLLALPRPKVLRRLWAQLAAVGVGRILLTNAERVEPDYWATHILSPATYEPLLIEGLQQARDTRVPQVTLHRRFRVLVEDELNALAGSSGRLVAHPGESKTIAEALRGSAADRVLLAVGPEGGWNAFELQLLEAQGFQRVALGARPLRTDTACIALLASTHAALEAGAQA